ncbi:uncharacterized protein LODBEIA_P52620 [Lodderomyces beijingensis]|uniref:Uncharacterized protein n=1 Tax=Lodderomyces beijingensis TaxID=1775926 RepID=A0ABP0ZSC1_9ASCO
MNQVISNPKYSSHAAGALKGIWSYLKSTARPTVQVSRVHAQPNSKLLFISSPRAASGQWPTPKPKTKAKTETKTGASNFIAGGFLKPTGCGSSAAAAQSRTGEFGINQSQGLFVPRNPSKVSYYKSLKQWSKSATNDDGWEVLIGHEDLDLRALRDEDFQEWRQEVLKPINPRRADVTPSPFIDPEAQRRKPLIIADGGKRTAPHSNTKLKEKRAADSTAPAEEANVQLQMAIMASIQNQKCFSSANYSSIDVGSSQSHSLANSSSSETVPQSQYLTPPTSESVEMQDPQTCTRDDSNGSCTSASTLQKIIAKVAKFFEIIQKFTKRIKKTLRALQSRES